MMTNIVFAQELTTRRIAARMSQVDLGIAAEVDRSYINRMESGDRVPRRAVAESLANGLRLTGSDRATFLLAAGHAPDPEDMEAKVFADEPVLRHAMDVLQCAPEPVADRLRRIIAHAVVLAGGQS